MSESDNASDRGFLIAQAVTLATLIAVIPLALFVVDISPPDAPAPSERRDAIFAFNAPSARDPLACPGGNADADSVPEGVPIAQDALAADCAILLSAADALAGDAALNWRADVPITEWNGVLLSGDPLRVAAISLTAKGLDGEIPPALSRLSALQGIALYGNDLSGEIPAEIGDLANLSVLDLGDNRLSGKIPPSLGNLSALTWLDVGFNQLEGEIPAEMVRLERVEWLILAGNAALGGSLSEILAAMPGLAYLSVYDTELTGCVPGNLRELDGFWDDNMEVCR